MGQTKEATKHTPGPWTRSGGSIVGPDGRSIWNPARGAGECGANYDLVCRAPSMEAEIERLRGELQRVADWNLSAPPGHAEHRSRLDVIAAARAALEVNDGR